MDSRTEERVKDWDSRPFSSGYEDLRDLADDGFSGAVETGTTTLFVLNGRVVGVVGGAIEAFEDASGTIYEAPHPSLPLLFAMREQGGEERAKYYTNDTPISEADGTLSSGSFTGYIELSENVLSGDYYVVYYGGKSMSCAFVGNQENLITDDEAFDRADDEVGIYTVWDVDIDVQEIPGGDDADASDASAAGATDADVGDAGVADDEEAGSPGAGIDDAEAVDVDTSGADASAAGTSAAGTANEDGTAGTVDVDAGSQEASADEPVAAPPVDDAEANVDADPVVDEAEPASGRRANRDSTANQSSGRNATPGPRDANDAGGDPVDSTDVHGSAMAEVPDEVMAEVEDEARANDFDDEAAWRETSTIPSINPERTTDDDAEQDPLASGAGSHSSSKKQSSRSTKTPQSGGRTHGGGSTPDRGRSPSRPTGSGHQGSAGNVDVERVGELEEALADVREERDEIETERDELARERDDLQERNRELQSRVESLESEVAELERELEAARDQAAAGDSSGATASVELSAREALEGTNLFVRYGSKSATTLEDVHDRDVGIADLESNLRLEYHTGFDAADAVVDGVPYDEFLYDSTPYQFVEWFVYDLVFEIRDTGNESDLRDLYEAFPKVDRIELYGNVSLRYDDGGEEHREQTTFDVVVRDRMGNPLAVANVNDSRDPASEDTMMDLQERASRVKRTSDAFAGAFMVTASYFEPGALEVAEEATGGSLLSRDSKKSYVKLSRKNGYHLCLVETRNGEFHVNVPEL